MRLGGNKYFEEKQDSVGEWFKLEVWKGGRFFIFR